MTSYNIDTTCWPHRLHMVVQGRVHSSQHGPSVGLYKVDQFVEEFSIKFSYVTQYKSSFIPLLGFKIITLELDTVIWDCLTQNLPYSLYYHSQLRDNTVLQSRRALLGSRHKGYTNQQGEYQLFVYTKAHWCTSDISPFVDVVHTSFSYQPCATSPLVVCLHRGMVACS